VYDEYRYQKELGLVAGWKFIDPDISADYKLVQQYLRWEGWKKVF
jgi:hypothetical protein